MYNKKVLIEALKKVNAAKAPAKKGKDVILDQQGQRKHPGQITQIQGDTMATDGYGNIPLMVYPNNGQPPQVVQANTGEHYFPGATNFTEVPLEEAKRGGIKSKKYSKSLSATNKLLKKNSLLKKKSYKSKTYDPNAMYFQPGGPINTAGPRAEEEYMEVYPIDSSPKVYGHEPEDYSKFLEYNKTAPENRRAYEQFVYGSPDSYDHYGMWDALGKPKDFEEALKINPWWEPDPYDNSYHGFSVNPYTGVFLKSGKPGVNKPGDTTWMEIAGHYLSPDAQKYTPVYDTEIQRFKYIPSQKIGGSLKPGCKPEPPTAAEVQTQVLAEGKGPTAEGAGRIKRAAEIRAAWEKRCGSAQVTVAEEKPKPMKKIKKKLGQLGPQSFKDGGYIEMELTEAEIGGLIKQGYRIEQDPSVPQLTKAQPGMIIRNAEEIAKGLKSSSQFRNMMQGLGALDNLPQNLPNSVHLSKPAIKPEIYTGLGSWEDFITSQEFENIDDLDKADLDHEWKMKGWKDLLDFPSLELLHYPNFDNYLDTNFGELYTGEELSSLNNLSKYLGDFNFKPFSPGYDAYQHMANLATFGKQPLLNRADFATQEEMFIDNLFKKYPNDPEAMMEEAKAMGISPDAVLKRTVTRLANPSQRNIFDRAYPFYLPENWSNSNRAALRNSKFGEYRPFAHSLNEHGTMGGKAPMSFGDFDQHYWDQIRKNEELLSGDYNMSSETKLKIQSQLSDLYQKGINQELQQKRFDLKNPWKYTGYDAMQTLSPNKYGGVLPKAQFGKLIKGLGNEMIRVTPPITNFPNALTIESIPYLDDLLNNGSEILNSSVDAAKDAWVPNVNVPPISFLQSFKSPWNFETDAFKPYSKGGKDFSDAYKYLQQIKATAAGPQRQLSTEDFFTDPELIQMANTQADYWNARDQFDIDYPEDPGAMLFGALTGDNRRDELFSLLYPNAYMPNFRSKFMTPRQEKITEDIIGPFTPSLRNKGLISPLSLKSATNLTGNEIPSEARDLAGFQKGTDWLMTAPAEMVVKEMRGGLGLTLEDFKNATPEQYEAWRQQIIDRIQKQVQERYDRLLGNPFTGGDAYSKMVLNKYGGTPKAQAGLIKGAEEAYKVVRPFFNAANIATLGTLNSVARKVPVMINPLHIGTLGFSSGERAMVGPFTGSPLNALPFYGKDLAKEMGPNEAFRYFGDNLDYVNLTNTLDSAHGPLLRLGRNRVMSDSGQWFEQGTPNASYSTVFGVRANPYAPGSNLKYMPKGNRNGVLIGDMSTSNPRIINPRDPGLTFYRRLPFSERHSPVNIDNPWDWKNYAGNAQSLAERYGYAAAYGAGLAAMGYPAYQETLDEYINQPVSDFIKKSKEQMDAFLKKSPIKKK